MNGDLFEDNGAEFDFQTYKNNIENVINDVIKHGGKLKYGMTILFFETNDGTESYVGILEKIPLHKKMYNLFSIALKSILNDMIKAAEVNSIIKRSRNDN